MQQEQQPVPEKMELAAGSALPPTQKIVFSKTLTKQHQASKNPGDEARIQALYFNGQPLIDIRRWAYNYRNELVPTKKGISLPLVRWVQLLEQAEFIDGLMEKIKSGATVDEKLPIGGPVILKMCSPFWTVHIREYYKDVKTGDVRPTRSGIILKHSEWKVLLDQVNEIQRQMPEIEKTEPCYLRLDHSNQEGMLSCPECSPWTFDD